MISIIKNITFHFPINPQTVLLILSKNFAQMDDQNFKLNISICNYSSLEINHCLIFYSLNSLDESFEYRKRDLKCEKNKRLESVQIGKNCQLFKSTYLHYLNLEVLEILFENIDP